MFRTVRRTITTLAAFCVAATTVLVAAPTASAHDELLSSQPADGEVVTTPPEAIVLKFSADLILTGAEIAVTNPGRKLVTTGPVTVSGSEVTTTLPSDLESGDYAVSWRVVSSDGHPITGDFTFTRDAADTSPSPTPSEAGSGEGAAGPSATPTSGPTGEPSTELAIDPPAGDQDPNSVSPTVLWLFAGIIAVLLITLAVLTAITKRRQRNQENK